MDGTFWTGGFDFEATTSGIDDILNQPQFSLEDLLNHDDIISECKYLNSDLIAYLSKFRVVEKLIRYVITPAPSPETKKTDDQPEKHFPYIASELFACEVMELLNVFFENPSLLDTLFSFLDQPPPLEPGNCAYFCKVVVVLLTKKHSQLISYIQSHNILDKTLTHIGVYSIMELLIRIGWDDGSGGMEACEDEDPNVDNSWLQKAQLIPKLVEKLSPKHEHEPEVHANAACALVDAVVKSSPLAPSTALLVADLQSKPILDTLFTYMFSGSPSSLTHTLSVAIVLVQSYTDRRLQEKHGTTEGEAEKKKEPEMASIIVHVVAALPKLLVMLKDPPKIPLKVQYGVLNPPCGPSRLKIVEIVLALVRCVAEDEELQGLDKATATITEMLIQSKAFTAVLSVFASYPWNNLLHGLVEGIIHTLLDIPQENEEPIEEPSQTTSLALLRKHLFGTSNLLSWITEIFKQNEEFVKQAKNCRLGCMGHLMRITAAIQEAYPISVLAELGVNAQEVKQWESFLDGTFKEDYQIQAVILGGHRPVPPAAGANNFLAPTGEMDDQNSPYGGILGDNNFLDFKNISQYDPDDDDDDDDFFNWEPRGGLVNNDSDDSDDDNLVLEEVHGAKPEVPDIEFEANFEDNL